ncbi:ComEC/Rec2 family competence protein [Rhodovibrionaceae bacterium A322]
MPDRSVGDLVPGNTPGSNLRQRGGVRNWLATVWRLEQQQHFLWLPVFYGLGIGLAFTYFPESPSTALVFLTLMALLAGVLHLRAGLPGSLLVCMVLLGLATVQLRVWAVAAPVLPIKSLSADFLGQVLSSQQTAKGPRVVLHPVDLTPFRNNLGTDTLPNKVRLLLPRDMAIPQPGSWLAGRGRFLQPPLPAVPGDYDFARVAYFQGLGAVGYSYGQPEVTSPRPGDLFANDFHWTDPSVSWHLFWNDLRWRVAGKIRAQLPPDQAGLAIALSVGDRGDLDPLQVEALRQSGLAHLLAISGLHLGLVAGSLFFFIRALLACVPPLALHFPIKKWAAAFAWVGTFFYFGLSGGSLPTERAFIMVSLSLLAIMIDRRAISLRVLAWSAFLVLFLRPESLLTASFQLSFAAVTVMIAAFEAWQRGKGGRLGFRDPEQGWIGRSARGVFLFASALMASSLLAGLATAPFVLFHFQRLASFGFLANLVAIPLASFLVMPLILLTLFLMPWGGEGLTLPFLGYCLSLLLTLAEGISNWPGAVQRYVELPLWGLLVSLLAGLWFSLWQQSWRYALLPLLLVLPLSIALHRGPDLLMSPPQQLWAVRLPNGALLVPQRAKDNFSVRQWIERSGKEPLFWDETSALALEDQQQIWGYCDPLGCRFQLTKADDHWLALSLDPRALSLDCRQKQDLLTFYPVGRRCVEGGVTVLLQARDFRNSGGIALYRQDDTWRLETVEEILATAPWRQNRERN